MYINIKKTYKRVINEDKNWLSFKINIYSVFGPEIIGGVGISKDMSFV